MSESGASLNSFDSDSKSQTETQNELQAVLSPKSGGLEDDNVVNHDQIDPDYGLSEGDDICAFCHETYKQPRVLYCLHVMCEQCIRDALAGKSGSDHGDLTDCELEPTKDATIKPPPASGAVRCPICQQDSQIISDPNNVDPRIDYVQMLLPDFVTVNFQDAHAIEKQAIVCTSCKSQDAAVARCSECATFLCTICVQAHQFMRCFENHKVVTFEEMKKTGDLYKIHKPVHCPAHPNEQMKFYCTTCQFPVCNECMLMTHKPPTHQHEKINPETETRIRTEIAKLIDESQKKVEACDSEIANLDQLRNQLDDRVEAAKEQITERCEEYKRMLEQIQQERLDELEKLRETLEQRIERTSNSINVASTRITDGCRFASRLLEHGNAMEVLSFKRMLNAQLLQLLCSVPSGREISVGVHFVANPKEFEHVAKHYFGYFGNAVDVEQLIQQFTGSMVRQQQDSQSGASAETQRRTVAVQPAQAYSQFAPANTARHADYGATAPSYDNWGSFADYNQKQPASKVFASADPTAWGARAEHAATSGTAGVQNCSDSAFGSGDAASPVGSDKSSQSASLQAAAAQQSMPPSFFGNLTAPAPLTLNSISDAMGKTFTTTAATAPSFGSASTTGSSTGIFGSGSFEQSTAQPGRALSSVSYPSQPQQFSYPPPYGTSSGGSGAFAPPYTGGGLMATPGESGYTAPFPLAAPPGGMGPPMNSYAAVTATGAMQQFGGAMMKQGSSPPPSTTIPPVRRGNMAPMSIRSKFGSQGSGPGQFNSPHGFCLSSSEEIIVSDTNNHRIQIFDKEGNVRGQFGVPGKDEGQLWYPRKVAVMRQSGRFVVCDRGNERSRMQIFDKKGQFQKRIAIRYVEIVAGLAVSEDGHIVAVDSVSPTVFTIEESGELYTWFDCSEHMREPSDIAVSGGEYFICDFKAHHVCVFSSQGSFLRRIGHELITHFPNGIDISDAGDVLIGDSHGNRFHVAVYTKEGVLQTEFECPSQKVSRCCGLKITSEGYVVTLAKNNHQVLVLNTLYVQ